LAEHGIIVSHEIVCFWVEKCGTQYGKMIRRDRPPVDDKRHLDEVVISIRGKKQWLWRALDQHGSALEILVQTRRNTQSAKRFMRKLMKQYGAAKRRFVLGLEHRSHKGLNNRAEVSHKPTRRREHVMGRFKSSRHARSDAFAV